MDLALIIVSAERVIEVKGKRINTFLKEGQEKTIDSNVLRKVTLSELISS